MNYLKFLEEGFAKFLENAIYPDCTRKEYLAQEIFDFKSYSQDVDEFYTTKALEICEVINSGDIMSYVADPQNRLWYSVILNTSFFKDVVEWGVDEAESGWVERPITVFLPGDWYIGGGSQEIKFKDLDQWQEFIEALNKFIEGGDSEN